MTARLVCGGALRPYRLVAAIILAIALAGTVSGCGAIAGACLMSNAKACRSF